MQDRALGSWPTPGLSFSLPATVGPVLRDREIVAYATSALTGRPREGEGR
jgi:hypothetical protein